ncbi:hypothetical protein E2562_016971 [Oryza meyeriana var. granulata]|uniref:Uncharacterized protein n=1 Tax=Oryza meyeriana var. granulata TaxID=110450 RepID=A0A6G1DWF0_9ORYZ|nr:hypothetical protein E2562_016971 [Oryza meyeriana var. granulata]
MGLRSWGCGRVIAWTTMRYRTRIFPIGVTDEGSSTSSSRSKKPLSLCPYAPRSRTLGSRQSTLTNGFGCGISIGVRTLDVSSSTCSALR